MHPILFTVAGFPVYSWGVFFAAAFIIGTLLAIPIAKRKNIEVDEVLDVAIFSCLGAIIFARLLFVILNWSLYQETLFKILDLRDGGLSFFGGLGGGILGGYICCKINNINVGKMADVAAAPIALSYAFARIGCLFNGCCHGLQTKVSWAVDTLGDGILRHPTQIYASVVGIVIFIILIIFNRSKKKADGQSMVLFMILYAIGRFIVEFFRVGPRNYFAPLTITQVLCIGILIISIALFVILGKNMTNEEIETSEEIQINEEENDLIENI